MENAHWGSFIDEVTKFGPLLILPPPLYYVVCIFVTKQHTPISPLCMTSLVNVTLKFWNMSSVKILTTIISFSYFLLVLTVLPAIYLFVKLLILTLFSLLFKLSQTFLHHAKC